MNKLAIKYIFSFLLIIFFIEVIFNVIFYISGSKYLDNKFETEKKYYDEISLIFKKKNIFKNHLEYDKKIGIFGGSSANGYGSTVSFSRVLKNYIKSQNLNYKIINYSTSASPFAYAQANIIKDHINNLDIVVIYAGHNEWITEKYNLDKSKNGLSYFDNGWYHPDLESLKQNWEKERSFNKYDNYLLTGGNNLFNQFTSNLRIYNFTFKSFYKIKKIINNFKIKKLKNNEITDSIIKKYSYNKKIIDDEVTTRWKNNFKKEIEAILMMLNEDQKIIIFTIPSEIFFPPIYNYVDEKEDIIFDFENSVENYINNNNIKFEYMPESSLKYFLKGNECIKNKKYLDSLCLDYLVKAKDLDQISIRIQSGINNYIRNLDNKNIQVIDFEENLLSSIYKKDYKRYLVDYHHPSHIGHLELAKLLIENIFNEDNIGYEVFDQCGSYKLFKNKIEILNLKISQVNCNNTAKINLQWFENVLKYFPNNYYYFFDKNIITAKTIIADD